jgi:hypothetical protein
VSVEYNILCDNCSCIVVGSYKSAADARREGIRDELLVRLGRRELCIQCAGRASKHAKRVKVLACANELCVADEEGCNSSECKSPLRWTWMYHDDFRERFRRCPSQCESVASNDETP